MLSYTRNQLKTKTMVKTTESNSAEKLQLSLILSMVIIYALVVVLTFQLKNHVFFLVSVPVFLAIIEFIRKYTVSEKVIELISRFKLAMLLSVIIAICILFLTGPAPANIDPSLLP